MSDTNHKFDVNRIDLYLHNEPELNKRVRVRLNEIANMGMEEVMTAEFGFKGVTSGFYLERIWYLSDDDYREYIDWAKGVFDRKAII